MPGPGSGIEEHEFKRRLQEQSLKGETPCDICQKRPATHLEARPYTCDSCAAELASA